MTIPNTHVFTEHDNTVSTQESTVFAEPYSKTIITRWADMDPNQHLRGTAYGDWAGFVQGEWLKAHGFDLVKLSRSNVGPVNFEENTKYFSEIMLGEHITIGLQLVGLNHDGSRYHMRHTFRRDGAICAVHEVKGAWFNTTSRRICPPPSDLFEAMTNIVRADDYAEIISSRGRGD